MKMNSKMFIGVAVAGMISAGGMVASTASAGGKDKGECMGANACKGKSGCKTATNECKGQNACKGKGFVEMTEAKCNKAAKKNKDVHFEAAPAAAAEPAKS